MNEPPLTDTEIAAIPHTIAVIRMNLVNIDKTIRNLIRDRANVRAQALAEAYKVVSGVANRLAIEQLSANPAPSGPKVGR